MKVNPSPPAQMSLEPLLTQLTEAGLVRVAQHQPELEYLFRHALIQDAAYASLLKRDRTALHRTVGETLEALFPDQREELAPVLARHFLESGDLPRALAYFRQAGDKAASAYANTEAIDLYGRALEVALSHPTLTTSEMLRHCFAQRGRAQELNALYPAALDTYKQMEHVAHERGDQTLELDAVMSQATLYTTWTPLYNPAAGQVFLARAQALAQTQNDPATEARILWNMMWLHNANDQHEAAIAVGEQGLTIARAHNLTMQIAFLLNDIQSSYRQLGQHQRARAVLDEARALWRELGNRVMLADNLSMSAFMMAREFNDLSQAEQYLHESLTISRSINNHAGEARNLWMMGSLACFAGRLRAGLPHLRDAERITRQHGLSQFHGNVLLELLNTYTALCAPRYAQTTLRQLHALVGSNISTEYAYFYQGMLGRIEAQLGHVAAAHQALAELQRLNPPDKAFVQLTHREILWQAGAYAQLETLCAEALRTLNHYENNLLADGFLLYQGRAQLALGQPQHALATLEAARQMPLAEQKQLYLWAILFNLARAEAACGQAAQAADHLHQARAIVSALAADIDDPALRDEFLSSPEVSQIMAVAAIN